MIKKILVGVFLIGVVGAVIAGIVALVSPTEHAYAQQERGTREAVAQQAKGEPQGNGQGGRYQQRTEPSTAHDESNTTGYGHGQQTIETDTETRARGYGRNRQNVATDSELGTPGSGRGQNRQETQLEHNESLTIEGTVIETAELVIETADGKSVQVGLGPSDYRDSQGFVLNVGDAVRVSGYWESPEADEFKATLVENQSTNTQIVLRDASGRPMWAGQGRRSGQNNNF